MIFARRSHAVIFWFEIEKKKAVITFMIKCVVFNNNLVEYQRITVAFETLSSIVINAQPVVSQGAALRTVESREHLIYERNVCVSFSP